MSTKLVAINRKQIGHKIYSRISAPPEGSIENIREDLHYSQIFQM